MIRNRQRREAARKHRSRINNRNNQLRYQDDFDVALDPNNEFYECYDANYSCHTIGQDDEMTAAVWIYGCKFRFLIDTGASVSVVHSVIYNALWKDIVPLYYSPQIIETVNGENAVDGEIYVDLDFQKFILQGQRFLVTNCAEYDGILGRDFLRSAKAVIDINKHTMICHERFKIKLDFDVKQWANMLLNK